MTGRLLQSKFLGLFSLLLLPFFSYSQHQVQIMDEDGLGLPGVQIYTDSYQINMISDALGVFIIPEHIKASETVNISYTGFKSVRVLVSTLREISTYTLEAGVLINEVVVVGRNNTSSDKIINTITNITNKEIRLSNPQTAADAIGQHSDVYIQKSQMGGGSPIVRGFEANKVLLVVDGVRLNNAIFRSGHLQNAITVDNQIMDRIEVIYGPGSLMYGSDALGGVVQFRTRDPKLNFGENKVASKTSFMTRFASANQEKTFHADVELSGRKLASLTSISYSDFGDLKAGSKRNSKYPDFGKRFIYAERINNEDVIVTNDDPNLQVGTGYSQVDILQKFKYELSKNLDFVANFQFSTSSNIPRYDQLIEASGSGLRFAEWYYGPQDRLLTSLRGTYRKSNVLFDQMIAIASYQQIGEDRIDRQFGRSNQAHQEETVNVSSLTIDFTKVIAMDFTLNYGLDFNYNSLVSVAYSKDVDSGIISNDEFSRYPDGDNSTRQLAAYFLLKKIWNNKHNLSGGLRINANQVALKYKRTDLFAWPQDFTDGLVSNNNALTGSIGYKFINNGWTISTMVATAFRAPNIDDIAKIRVNGNEVSVPNLALNPEQSLSGELSISKNINNKHSITATGFYTLLSDAIVRSRGSLPNGNDILIDNGDTLLTFINTNAAEAKLYGLSINGQSQISDHFTILGSWSYVKGRQKDEGIERPLSHIPPQYGKVELKYTTQASDIILNSRFNAAKPLSEYGDSTDNPELATAEGSLAWYTLNLYANHTFKNKYSLHIGVENIFDQFYRPFASGVAGPGRNLILSLRVDF